MPRVSSSGGNPEDVNQNYEIVIVESKNILPDPRKLCEKITLLVKVNTPGGRPPMNRYFDICPPRMGEENSFFSQPGNEGFSLVLGRRRMITDNFSYVTIVRPEKFEGRYITVKKGQVLCLGVSVPLEYEEKFDPTDQNVLDFGEKEIIIKSTKEWSVFDPKKPSRMIPASPE